MTWKVAVNNVFKLNIEGATEEEIPIFHEGKVWARKCLKRNGLTLPKYGAFDIVQLLLQKESEIVPAIERLGVFLSKNPIYPSVAVGVHMAMVTLESMINDGWVTAEYDPSLPLYEFRVPEDNDVIHRNIDIPTVGAI